MRWLPCLLLLLAGCSKGLPANAPSGPPGAADVSVSPDRQPPAGVQPTEVQQPEPEPAAGAPSGVGPLVATVISGDQQGALSVKFESVDLPWLADRRMALYRAERFIANFVVAWGSRDDEANQDVLMCRALTHDDFEIIEGDKFYLIGGLAGRGGQSHGGGFGMPFGDSMFGPWRVGGGPVDP